MSNQSAGVRRASARVCCGSCVVPLLAVVSVNSRPSGNSPKSSGRRRMNRSEGNAPTTMTNIAITNHAARQSYAFIVACAASGIAANPNVYDRVTYDIARARRAMNQFAMALEMPISNGLANVRRAMANAT